MGIYLGATALGGGGGSAPLLSYGTFETDHTTTVPFVDSTGGHWLRTGVAITNVADYPDVTASMQSIKDINYVGSGTASTGSGFIYDAVNNKYVWINAITTTWHRWNTVSLDSGTNLPIIDGGETSNTSLNIESNAWVYNGTEYLYDRRKIDTGMGSVDQSSGTTPENVEGSQFKGMGFSNGFGARGVNDFTINNYWVHSQESATPEHTIINLDTATGTNIETSDLVQASIPGYAVYSGSGTTYWSVEGANEFSSITTTIAREREVSTGALTGNTLEFPSVNKTVSFPNASTSERYMNLVLLEDYWVTNDPAQGSDSGDYISVIAMSIVHPPARFTPFDISNTATTSATRSINTTTPVYVKIRQD